MVQASNFLYVGKPTGVVASAGVIGWDIENSIEYKQVTVPYGSQWIVYATGVQYSPETAGVTTLTTTGTSGPATLVGTTLNIPVYSSGGGSTGPDVLIDMGTFLAPTGVIDCGSFV